MNEKKEKPAVDRILTGCDLIDILVGGGMGLGWPRGKMINIVGDKSAGKTFEAVEINAANYHQYKGKFKSNYDDCEDGFTFDTKGLYGMKLVEDDTYRSNTVQEFEVHCNKFLNKLKEGEVGIYTLDSLDALTDQTKLDRAEEREKNYDKGEGATNKSGTYSMEAQKFLSQEFFRIKTGQFARKGATLIIISQVRENINAGMFGKKLKRSGGKAMDFYAHTCLWLATKHKIIEKDRCIGVVVEASLEKSKTPRPFRSCFFTFYFDYGIDNIGTSLDYLFDLRSNETGALLPSRIKEIIWEEGKQNLTVDKFKKWLEENNLLDKAKQARKEAEGKTEIHLGWMKKWVLEQNDFKAKFYETFGEGISREELIEKIDKDPKMEKELKERVIAKWEAIEDSLKTNRKRKYL
jgi:RecA/RadA recombinase